MNQVQERQSAIWPHFPPSAPGMRVGVLGGTFNPAHDGHRQISLEALRRLRLDRVWWLVTPGNPLKDHAGLPVMAARMRGAEQVARHPRIIITGVEAELRTSFTARTLARITERHMGVRFVWLMGADNLAQFHRWRDWNWIMESIPIAVFDRPGWRLPALAALAAHRYSNQRWREYDAAAIITAPAPAWTYLSIPLSPLSSTLLRVSGAGPQGTGVSKGWPAK